MTIMCDSRESQDTCHQVVVGQHDPFGEARGATRVHDASQVVTWSEVKPGWEG